MADKKKDDKKSKPKKHHGGEMSFGLEIILFLIAIFAVWVLTGKSENKVNTDKPFIKGQTSLPQ